MRIRLSRSIVPNLFTVLNIFFGFLCIVQAVKGRFVVAAWYIIFAAICDTLDGVMARLTKSASEFGVELDSLADVVSFGAAPSVLFYTLVLQNYGPFGMLVASSQLIFGALRLARFNVQLVGFSKEYFIGVPIPLSALTLVSYILFFSPEKILAEPIFQHVFIALILCCGLLMVSTIRYPVLPKFSFHAIKVHPVQISLFTVAGVLIIVSLGKALFAVLFTIVISGIVLSLIHWLGKLRSKNPTLPLEDNDNQSITIDPH